MNKPPKLSVLGAGRPVEVTRKGDWIKHFSGGAGDNNCPRFWYIRDGFGCTFTCQYCYLQRFDFHHPAGAELNPDLPTLYKEVEAWLARDGHLGLILGEVTDAWGWAHLETVRARNLRLIEMFRAQDRHDLVFLTKSGKVSAHLAGVVPTPRVILSWSVQAPAVAETYEMGADQARSRLTDATACRQQGWRIRVRLDPMIPIAGWEDHYRSLAESLAQVLRPEQVTCGSWRPRKMDPMCVRAGADLRALLELGPDGRFRPRNRLAMYTLAWGVLHGAVPELSLCKEELAVQAALYARFGVTRQACNCLGAAVEPVGLPPAARRTLPVVGGAHE